MAFVFQGLDSQEISHDDTEPVSGLTNFCFLLLCLYRIPGCTACCELWRFSTRCDHIPRGTFSQESCLSCGVATATPLASTLHDKERGLVPVLCMGRFGGQVSRVHQGC